MTGGDFASAIAALSGGGDSPDEYCAPFIDTLPISGAAVSTLGELLGTQTIVASDTRAARLDELQFDLGEGPCWDAVRTAQAVLEPDLPGRGASVWPAFAVAGTQQNVSSIFAFPLIVGSLRIGAVDLYSLSPVQFSGLQVRQAGALANVVAGHVLRRALSEIGEDFEDQGNAYSRRLVHQATGVVLAQLNISASDALLVIQGQAFASSRSMMDIATEILNGSMTFTNGASGIEMSE